MKYFIDFEATQFSEEIISVGCKREDGETFYALVRPVEGKIHIHSMNPVGVQNMRAIIEKNGWREIR